MNEHLCHDTIAAIATPPGRGGVGIIRVSGPLVCEIANCVLGDIPLARQAHLKSFRDSDAQVIDMGVALYFKSPHSFTGEDVLELQGHGGPVIMDMLLARVLQCGARIARPGEFSERAFLNGKMDLAQCEAVADLIDASSQQAALSASRSLQGVFSKKIHSLSQDMMSLRMYVEAAIDFPEEEVDFLSEGLVLEKIESLLSEIRSLQKNAKQGQILREGISIVMAGLPNAGKSSLLNCLTQAETAIVTSIPGTTRDVIKETIHIDGYPVNIIDTAGIRLHADVVEQEGIRRAKEQLNLADRILLILDGAASEGTSEIELEIMREHGHKVTQVINKIDIANIAPGFCNEKIYLSAKTGQGIEILYQHLKDCMGLQSTENSSFIARRRHLDALEKAHQYCQNAHFQLVKSKAGELVAQELRQAQEALGEIVGKITTDDLLGQIFSSFCIGK